MIHSISADSPLFKNVEFREGLNLVLADITAESSEKDSRNGLGKTSLIHVVHFCLGGNLPKHLDQRVIGDIAFRIVVDVGATPVSITRSTTEPTVMSVEPSEWLDDAQPVDLFRYRVEDVVAALGKKWFGLGARSGRYAPSTRALLSYFARRGHDAYVEPLKYFHSQPGYQQQILAAYLTGVAWEYPRDQRMLKEEEDGVKALRKAAASGILGSGVASAGDLRALKVTLDRRLARISERISSFRVHPQYQEFEQVLVRVSEEARETTNELASTRRLLQSYDGALESIEAEMSGIAIDSLYHLAGIELPGTVVRTIEEVRAFHSLLAEQRITFLMQDRDRAAAATVQLGARLARLQRERQEVADNLARYGALQQLQNLEAEARQIERELGQVDEQLSTRSRIDQGVEHIKARRVENREIARKQMDRENQLRDRVIELFDEYWEELYGSGARLAIDLTDTGFRYEWTVSREGSEGVGKMKIFAYDLAVATAWHERSMGPGFLIHDSTIWDGVDERQVSAGLRLAGRVSDSGGWQYITFFNSDALPEADPGGVAWAHAIVLRLTDKTAEGQLFGYQF